MDSTSGRSATAPTLVPVHVILAGKPLRFVGVGDQEQRKIRAARTPAERVVVQVDALRHTVEDVSLSRPVLGIEDDETRCAVTRLPKSAPDRARTFLETDQGFVLPNAVRPGERLLQMERYAVSVATGTDMTLRRSEPACTPALFHV